MILGIGIDVEEVERVRASIERHGERFLRRIYTPGEIAYVEARARRFERYAARFAAKEAAMKALGTGWGQGVGWRDVEVVNSPDGRPSLRLTGGARAAFDAKRGAATHVSLTHTRAIAAAHVVLESGPEAVGVS